ncbi:MAG: GTP diphosphokinase [Gammaproteobacteria bacterium]|nr:GTP diphosphokinase [Gammaproteobacteria bacterium]
MTRDAARGAPDLSVLLETAPECDGERVAGAWRMLDRTGAADVDRREALAVTRILSGLHLDSESLCAVLLHAAVARGELALDAVRESLGADVAGLVEGVVRMDTIRDHVAGEADAESHARQTESLRKMLMAMVEDVRVVLVKLAVRLQAMRGLRDRPEAERRQVAEETRDIFAPLANRLGIWQLKWELEDLAFRYLEPETYQQLARALAERRVDRERYLDEVTGILERELRGHGLAVDVSSRSKHLYSIWRKMQRKGVGLEEIFDARAIRILVDEVAGCYAALGVVHGLWKHIPREFDDYIANPKPNGYRSLHTAVIGPEGRTLEVQIRTFEMHRKAELGIAAHWRYKEGGRQDQALERKVHWLRQLLEWKDEFAGSEEFAEHFRIDDTDDRVYVFTPQGRIIDLARGATPLDFAYHVHTDVGHRCRGAKVDGKIVPLTTELRTGQQVEVLTTKQPAPSRDWLNRHLGYLKTTRARSKVRHWFRTQDHDKNVAAGRAVLDRELKRLGASEIGHERLAQQMRFERPEELYAALGFGDLTTAQVAGAVGALLDKALPRAKPLGERRRRHAARSGEPALRIHGVGDLLTQIARCCAPVPGDPCIGFITRGRGVTVHRSDCPNILRLDESKRDRLIEVHWSGEEADAELPATISVHAYDRTGLLRDITAVFGNEGVNVVSIHSESDRGTHTATIQIRVEAEGIEQLSRVISRIGALTNVLDVARVQ